MVGKHSDILSAGDIEWEQKGHQELQANLLAIKYVQTVHKNNNN